MRQPTTQDEPLTGVFFADAPDGYEALTLYLRGRRLIRIEIAAELYSPGWRIWLSQFAHPQRKRPLTLIG